MEIVDYRRKWVTIGFIEGPGTTNEKLEYSYLDNISRISTISFAYRLKQINLKGSYEYGDEVFVENTVPMGYVLHQNYPNPFSPTNIILLK